MDDWELPNANSYNEHAILVDEAHRQKAKAAARKAKKTRASRPRPKKKRTITKKELSRRQILAKFTSTELYQELGRRSAAARRETWTPEKREEWRLRTRKIFDMATANCRHNRKPPYTPKKGKNAGKTFCGSCKRPIVVPKVEQPTGELETVS